MNNNQFKKIIAKNKKQVKRWPKWKQNITISARAAETGEFIVTNSNKRVKTTLQEELAMLIDLRLSVSHTGYDYRNIANNIAERILELYIVKRKE